MGFQPINHIRGTSKKSSAFDKSKSNTVIKQENYLLKKGVWLYFLLLIFEGALRKWLLPSLSTPLLLVRDPVALWLIIVSWNRGILSFNRHLIIINIIGIVGIFTALFFGHGNLLVALYGARILLLHFPLIFIIGKILSKEDVIDLGKVCLAISIFMGILTALQFYSPQSAWVNRGIGGNMEGGGFSGALGFYRPPGTFSFTNGNVLFFGFAAPFVIYFWFNFKRINKVLLIASTISLLIAIPLSISRTLFFMVCLSSLFAIIAIARTPKYIGRLIYFIFGAMIATAILSQMNFFQTATEAFTVRFEGANEYEGGVKGVLADRYLGELLNSITSSINTPIFGAGLGLGTSVGAFLATGTTALQMGEGEWGRVIGELGVIMGLTVIVIRVSLAGKIALKSFKKLTHGELLPWMLLSFTIVNLPQGQWAQPTSLGFGVLSGGLLIASLKARHENKFKKDLNKSKTTNTK